MHAGWGAVAAKLFGKSSVAAKFISFFSLTPPHFNYSTSLALSQHTSRLRPAGSRGADAAAGLQEAAGAPAQSRGLQGQAVQDTGAGGRVVQSQAYYYESLTQMFKKFHTDRVVKYFLMWQTFQFGKEPTNPTIRFIVWSLVMLALRT